MSVNASNLTLLQDGISATLTLDPKDPVSMEDTKITLYIEENSLPLEGADVIFNLSMPGMKMPENKNIAIEEKPGTYSATTLLTMSGNWHLQAGLTENTRSHSFGFDFKVQ